MSTNYRSNLVDVAVIVKHETPKAYLVTDDGKREMWIPKSQCELVSSTNRKGREGLLTLPEWLAKEKGLI